MISEFERYHGVALRTLVVNSGAPVTIEKCDRRGWINSFLLNGQIGIHIKHSSKRLPPWQFTFTEDHLNEVIELQSGSSLTWLVLVCGWDGIVSLSMEEFLELSDGAVSSQTPFVRIDRDRRSMYRVFGNSGKLRTAKANGMKPIIMALRHHLLRDGANT